MKLWASTTSGYAKQAIIPKTFEHHKKASHEVFFFKCNAMKYLLILSFCCFSRFLFAQVEPGVESGVYRLEKGLFDSHQLMIGRKVPPPEVKGDYYLDSDWHRGTFTMQDGRQSAEYPMRYDVENALLEIRWGSTAKVAGEEYLSGFRWKEDNDQHERVFVNGKSYSFNGVPVAGFLELVYAGEDSLLMQPLVQLKQPDYVAGLDMGSRDAEIISGQKFFISKRGVLTEIRNRRNFLQYAGTTLKPALRKYISEQNLNFDQAQDLAVLMNYVESSRKSNSLKK